MRAARSADSRASAVRSAAAAEGDDPCAVAAAAAAVVVEEVPDILVDDVDPGGGLFIALAALCEILLLAVVVAYPRPVDAQQFCAAIAKHRSVPLALRPLYSVHIRLSHRSNNRPCIRERNIVPFILFVDICDANSSARNKINGSQLFFPVTMKLSAQTRAK